MGDHASDLDTGIHDRTRNHRHPWSDDGVEARHDQDVIRALSKKEAVRTEQSGKKYIYYPAISEGETVKSATENLFSHICAKRIGETIAELVAEAELTEADVEKIKEQLVKKKTVDTIACNCIPGQCECNHHKD